MPTYQRIPEQIEAVTGHDILNAYFDDRLLHNETWEKTNIKSVAESGDVVNYIYNPLHDSWIKFKERDMIRIDLLPDDIYPIDRDYFEKNFQPY